jgi:hypothetical protein
MQEKAQAHLLEECPDKEKYIAIKDAHDKIKATYLKSEKTSNAHENFHPRRQIDLDIDEELKISV